MPRKTGADDEEPKGEEMAALLTTEDVLNKKFTTVKFRDGYDQVEVDEFLDEVVKTIYDLTVENQDLKEKLEASQRRVSELSGAQPVQVQPVPQPEPQPVAQPEPVAPPAKTDTTSATSMLALAQRVHDEYIRDGKEESERIIAEARQKGDEIVADAEHQHDTVLAQLDQERSLLENKINELRSFESDYRSAIRTHLEGLMTQLQAKVE